MTHIYIIAAIQKKDRGLGKNNDLLWKIPEDLRRFKALTTGHPIIMGRKTYESIGRPLPNRTNIIITRNPEYRAPGCTITNSLQQAVEKAKTVDHEKLFILGGSEIYTHALPLADSLLLTLVEGDKEGDVFFPDYSEFTSIISQEDHPESDPPYSYCELTR